jgi:hypothetical protein
MLALTGSSFWQDESYDHLVRDESEFQRIVEYIEMNPVNAGLVTMPEAFPWSSAGKSGQYGGRTEADCQSAAGFEPAPQNPIVMTEPGGE